MKTWFTSKTLWLNTIAVGLAWFLNHQGILAAAGLDAQTQVTILGIINFVNRFFTRTELK